MSNMQVLLKEKKKWEKKKEVKYIPIKKQMDLPYSLFQYLHIDITCILNG